MSATPLNYASPDAARLRERWPWRKVGVLAVVAFIALAGSTVTFSETSSRVDSVTGSMMSKTVWPLGITFRSPVHPTPLAVQLTKRGIPWTPNWQPMGGVGCTLFGRVNWLGCGGSTPTRDFTAVLAQFAAIATDAELRDFVRDMQSGVKTQEKAAVDAACERVIGHLMR